jgi:hypothetical protein
MRTSFFSTEKKYNDEMSEDCERLEMRWLVILPLFFFNIKNESKNLIKLFIALWRKQKKIFFSFFFRSHSSHISITTSFVVIQFSILRQHYWLLFFSYFYLCVCVLIQSMIDFFLQRISFKLTDLVLVHYIIYFHHVGQERKSENLKVHSFCRWKNSSFVSLSKNYIFHYI